MNHRHFHDEPFVAMAFVRLRFLPNFGIAPKSLLYHR